MNERTTNRRSSYGVGICSLPCSRRSSYAHSPSSLGVCDAAAAAVAAAAANYSGAGGGASCQCSLGSRRSSTAGSMSHVSTSEEYESPGGNGGYSENVGSSKAYNRVMSSNHRAVTKPKDVKFKRISKAKSRSLEELRGKLKWQQQQQQQCRAAAAAATAGTTKTLPTSSPLNPAVARVVSGGGITTPAARKRGLFRHLGASVSLDHDHTRQSEA